MTHLELCQRVCDTNRRLAGSGLIVLSFGNVSGVDRASGVAAIKPSGIAYADLVPDNIVLVSLDTGAAPRGSASRRQVRRHTSNSTGHSG